MNKKEFLKNHRNYKTAIKLVKTKIQSKLKTREKKKWLSSPLQSNIRSSKQKFAVLNLEDEEVTDKYVLYITSYLLIIFLSRHFLIRSVDMSDFSDINFLFHVVHTEWEIKYPVIDFVFMSLEIYTNNTDILIFFFR